MKKKRKLTLTPVQLVISCIIIAVAGLLIAEFGIKEENPKTSAPISSSEQTFTGENTVKVHYIDVGQGDCELIQTKSKNILIDCGEKSMLADVEFYLTQQGIKRLDYIVMTHPHSDHMGGMGEIINDFPTINIIMPDIQDSALPVTSAWLNLLDSIELKDVNKIFAKPNTSIVLDEGSADSPVLEIVAPVKDYDDLNDYSITCRLVYKNVKFLFTGDIEKKAEADIVSAGADISADVLKVAHHGSDTSSSRIFLEKVKPKYAVISCGAGNRFGHPARQTSDALEKIGAEILRTDLNGNIVFTTDGNKIFYKTQK